MHDHLQLCTCMESQAEGENLRLCLRHGFLGAASLPVLLGHILEGSIRSGRRSMESIIALYMLTSGKDAWIADMLSALTLLSQVDGVMETSSWPFLTWSWSESSSLVNSQLSKMTLSHCWVTRAGWVRRWDFPDLSLLYFTPDLLGLKLSWKWPELSVVCWWLVPPTLGYEPKPFLWRCIGATTCSRRVPRSGQRSGCGSLFKTGWACSSLTILRPTPFLDPDPAIMAFPMNFRTAAHPFRASSVHSAVPPKALVRARRMAVSKTLKWRGPTPYFTCRPPSSCSKMAKWLALEESADIISTTFPNMRTIPRACCSNLGDLYKASSMHLLEPANE